MYRDFVSTKKYPTHDSYMNRKLWKVARHRSGLPDTEISRKCAKDADGDACWNCLKYGWAPVGGNGDGLCWNHMDDDDSPDGSDVGD